MNSVLGSDSTPISMNDSRPKKNVGSEFDDAYTTYLPRILSIDRWPEASTLDPTTLRSRGGQNVQRFGNFFSLSHHRLWKITLHCFTKRFLAGKKLFSYLCIRLDSAAVETNDVNGRCHATNFSRFKFRQRMEISSYSRLPITRTLANSNLALTRTKIDFPWISVIHLL